MTTVMGTMKKWLGSSQMFAAMLAVQVFSTGLQLLSKVILTQGTFIFALLAYRHLVAALCVAPLALYFERETWKNMGWSTWFWLFTSALTGITMAMGLFYYGFRDTTATYSINLLSILPIVTFVFSVVFGLGLGSKAGKIKMVGAILCVGGALTASLYKGKAFHVGDGHHFNRIAAMDVSNSHWTRGTFLVIGSCMSYATWYLLQVKLLKAFPSKYRATMITCIIASLQSAAIGLCLDRSKAAWRLEWNLQLITIVYSGALCSAAAFCLLSWTIAKRGPIYATMFNPLTPIFVAISETLLLGEQMWLGTVLGMVMIIVGLYSFLWGKKKELKLLQLAQSNELAEAVPQSVELKTSEPV